MAANANGPRGGDSRAAAINNYHDDKAAEPTRQPILRRMSDVPPERVEWLWPNRLAVGKLSLIAGQPGLGKSFLTIDLAARVSRGWPWPDCLDEPQPAGDVLLVSAEDDAADTIAPRLLASGADLERVRILDGVAIHLDADRQKQVSWLADDVAALDAAIDKLDGCRLACIDPISCYLPSQADGHSTSDVRGVLAPLAELAQRRRVALVMVSHLNKASGMAALDRVTGSTAFIAAARAGWLVARDPLDSRRKLFLPLKNNLGFATGLAFELRPPAHGGETPCVAWSAEPVEMSADDALTPPPRKRGPDADARNEAEAWLADVLADGDRLARDVYARAEADSVARRTLERAKASIGVVVRRDPAGWWWTLPRQDRQTPPPGELGDLGDVGQQDRQTPPPGELGDLGDVGQPSSTPMQINAIDGMNGKAAKTATFSKAATLAIFPDDDEAEI